MRALINTRLDSSVHKGLDQCWTAVASTLVTIAVIVMIQALRVFGSIVFPYPALFLLPAVAFAAHRAGFRTAMLSQLAAVSYEWLYFSVPGDPFHYTAGNFLRVLTFTAVTPTLAVAVVRFKRKTAEALASARLQHRRELLREQARLESIAESLPLGLLMVDANGNIVMSNSQLTAILRHPPNELAHPSCERMFSESRQMFLQADLPLARILAGGPAINEEVLYLRGDNTMVSLRISATSVRGNAREIIGAAVMLEDITGQKLARQSAQEMAALVNASSDAIYRVSKDGLILSWNPGAQRLLGYTADEIRYTNMRALIPTTLEDGFQRLLVAIRTGKQAYGFSTIFVHKDGSRVPVSMNISPVFGADEAEVIGASLVVRALETEICFQPAGACAA